MEEVFCHTVASLSEGFYKEKGSKFISFCVPVRSEEEVKEHLEEYKKQFYDARHVCFAYVLGIDGDQTRAYDDGEPNHSAGDPILGQIKSAGLTNTLVVVIRYFGGTKLGVGGLVTAYKTAAEDAVQKATVIKEVPKEVVKHAFKYEDMNRIMGVVKQYELELINQRFELDCDITVAVPLHLVEEVVAKLKSEYA